MELYNIYENGLIAALTRALNAADENESITEEEINEFLREELGDKYRDVIPEDLKKTSYFGLFYSDDQGRYFPILKTAVPEVMPLIEQEALKNALSFPEAKIFLSEEEISDLLEQLAEVSPSWTFEDFDVSNEPLNPLEKNRELCHRIHDLLKAAEEKKVIHVENRTISGELRKGTLYPLAVEYTVSRKIWTLNCWDPVGKTGVNLNIGRIEKMEVSSDPYPAEAESSYSEYLKKHLRTCEIQIETVRYALDRILRVFSYYEKEVRFNYHENQYLMELKYYDFDEYSLVRNILSAGEFVIVRKPLSLRNQIIREIDLILQNRS